MVSGNEGAETIKGVGVKRAYEHRSQGLWISSVLAVNGSSPAIPPKHSKESQRSYRSSLSRKLLLILLSLMLKEKLSPACVITGA